MKIKLRKFITRFFILLVSLNLFTGYGFAADENQQTINLTLEDALRLALRNDEALEMARQEIMAARADILSAKAQRLPHLEIAGQYGRNIYKPVFFLPEAFQTAMDAPAKVEMGEDNEFACAVSLTLNLWTAGRVSAAIEASNEAAEAFEYRHAAVGELTRYRVKEAYYNVLLAEKRLRIAEKAFSQTKEAARIAGVGYREGSVSRFDKMRAETELANRRAPLTYQRNSLRQKIIILKRRCGLDYSAKVYLSDSLSTAVNLQGIDYLLRLMRENSPEIKALKHRMNAGKQNLRLRKAGKWPMLQISANYAVLSQWSRDYFPEMDYIARSSAVTLGFTIPIFDGFTAKGEIKRARAELRVSELELERTMKEKETAVRNARLGLESALESLKGCRGAVKLAEAAHRIALVRLENGMGTSLERLDSELAMTTARAQLAEALYSCTLAEAMLELSIGAEVSEDSIAIDKKEITDD